MTLLSSQDHNLIWQQTLSILEKESGILPKFRVSESPIFLTTEFIDKLHGACDSIISQIKEMSPQELDLAIPDDCRVPNDTLQPHFFTIDFGICQNEKGEIVPELIELQSFPTLYCFQKELQNAFVSEYDFLKPLKTPKSDEQYYQELRDLIVLYI